MFNVIANAFPKWLGTSRPFGWAGTDDEDVHQSFGALLPVRACGDEGYADERPQKIVGVEIAAEIAAVDGALGQQFNGFADLTAGTFKELRCAAHHGIERRGDDLLGGHVVDEQQHPGSQRFERRHRFSKIVRCSGQFFNMSAIDRLDEGIPGREMAIQGSGSDARLSGDVVEAGVGAVASKGLFGHFQDALAIAQGIGAGFARSGLCSFCGHGQNSL
jgi:hypothetical protein